jgi:hypothetical protein
MAIDLLHFQAFARLPGSDALETRFSGLPVTELAAVDDQFARFFLSRRLEHPASSNERIQPGTKVTILVLGCEAAQNTIQVLMGQFSGSITQNAAAMLCTMRNFSSCFQTDFVPALAADELDVYWPHLACTLNGWSRGVTGSLYAYARYHISQQTVQIQQNLTCSQPDFLQSCRYN